jgi:hypothetical protein
MMREACRAFLRIIGLPVAITYQGAIRKPGGQPPGSRG